MIDRPIIFFVGLAVGFLIAAGVVLYAGGTLLKAKRQYENCLSDGGTKDHCVDKYFLGEIKR